MTMVLYAFRRRKILMDAYEAVSGARMHAAYYRPGGVYRDSRRACHRITENKWKKPADLVMDAKRRAFGFAVGLEDFAIVSRNISTNTGALLTDNRIWKQRLVDVGIMTRRNVPQLSFSRRHAAWLRHCLGSARKKQPHT